MTLQTDEMLQHIAGLEDRIIDMKVAHDEEDDGAFEAAADLTENLLRLLRANVEALAAGPQTEPGPQPGD